MKNPAASASLHSSTHRHRLFRRLGGLLAASVLLPGAFLAVAVQAEPFYFSTLAGAGAAIDHTDGSGSNARLMNPTGAAVDASGNIYVADGGDHTIRRITPDGNVSTFAGAPGQAGSNDGASGDARFLYPFAVAVDGAGNVFVADSGNHNIRRISNGSVSTIAGTPGIAGRADGVGTAALFNAPQGIAVDAAGNVYVADTNNSTVRKIAPGGAVTTLAGVAGSTGSGDGNGGSARFNYPVGLAVDAAGVVYVADFGNSVIRKVTGNGDVTTFAGAAQQAGNVDGAGGAARFDHPMAVSVDAGGNVYVADTSSQTIRMISPSGGVSTRAGRPGFGGRSDGSGSGARFFYPAGLAATAGGTVYIADTGNHVLRVMSPGGDVGTLAGSIGQTGSTDASGSAALFAYPDGIAVDGGGNVVVADRNNHVIRRITAGGAVSTLAGAAGIAGSADGPGAAARFNQPTGVAIDGSGNVYVADAGNSTIRKIAADGSVSTFAGAAGSAGSNDGVGAGARFNAPQGVAVDTVGNVYVADTNNSTLRKITSNGTVSTLAGAPGQTGSGDGAGGSARFNQPYAVAVDSSGNVYVADFFNATIRKLTAATGGVSTLAGAAGQLGYTDGSGSVARFNQPYGVAADNNGNVYVADTYNRVIRKVTSDGGVATVTGTGARFYYPEGIAVDGAGNLYVADGDNQAILRGGIAPPPPSGTTVPNVHVAPGGTATFNFSAASPGTNYQWQVSTDAGATWVSLGNDATYSGTTTATLTVTAAAATMNGYRYRVQLSNASGSSVSASGTLTVSTGGGVVIGPPGPPGSAQIVNVSIRTFIGTGENALTLGFVVGGSGEKPLLIRGVGPTLASSYGVGGVLDRPQLTLFDGSSATLATNAGWAGDPALSGAFTTIGAFPFADGSTDAAMVQSLAANTSYTVGVSGVNGTTGVALAEIYDANPAAGSRLVNISARGYSGTDSNVLILGFVIGGSGTERLLIRGIGPTLANYGLGGLLANPQLSLFNSANELVASVGAWGGDSELAAIMKQAGAFDLDPGSADSAMLLNLPSGIYTVQLSGINRTSGLGLIEVYELH
jgi:sugar lactone lactonase YvrE